VLLARKAPVGVIFRRGPSRQVLLVHWRTDTDTFFNGQWFKGRIYEYRCDLSPSGRRLIYFAATYRKPYRTWTAVSRPPYFTALALWPKGDAWGGGGLFSTEERILLNHDSATMDLAEGFRLPESVYIQPFGPRSGAGEDDPIDAYRLKRDGWVLQQAGASHIQKAAGASPWIEYDPPVIWSRLRPGEDGRWELRKVLHGIKEQDGPWYVIEHVLVIKLRGEEISIGRTEWADWCHSGDLLFAKEGRLYRLGFDDAGELRPLSEARQLIDLRGETFVPRPPPEEAKSWDAELQLG